MEAPMKKLSVVLILFLSLIISSGVHAEEYGVYVKVAEKVSGTFDEVIKNTESALTKNGWHVLASYDAAVPEGCGFKAHTIVMNSSDYSQKILSHGPTSAFAIPLRVGIFTDEKGINISFLNPASINRTVIGDTVEKDLSAAKMKELSTLLASAGKGTIVNQQIGEIRSKGHVGGMGGGAFNDKVEVIYKKEDTGSNFNEIAAKVKEGILSNNKGWRLVYTLEPGNNVIVYGIDKPKMESRAFKIAGEKRESKNNPCPGIDHTSAFPVEVVVLRESGMVKVVTLDEMYRMKVYFEDAGKWAFMKNMGMPGSIEKEIIEISGSKLK
jgi:uncharacterized protein (DUF302 family)